MGPCVLWFLVYDLCVYGQCGCLHVWVSVFMVPCVYGFLCVSVDVRLYLFYFLWFSLSKRYPDGGVELMIHPEYIHVGL